MWKGPLRKQWVLVAVVLCVVGMAACSSDDDLGDGGSGFRNLGKRGDSDIPAARAGTNLK